MRLDLGFPGRPRALQDPAAAATQSARAAVATATSVDAAVPTALAAASDGPTAASAADRASPVATLVRLAALVGLRICECH